MVLLRFSPDASAALCMLIVSVTCPCLYNVWTFFNFNSLLLTCVLLVIYFICVFEWHCLHVVCYLRECDDIPEREEGSRLRGSRSKLDRTADRGKFPRRFVPFCFRWWTNLSTHHYYYWI